MIYNPQMECMDQETKQKQQAKNLKHVLQRVYEKVDFYRERMNNAGVAPSDIQTIDDIKKLPFTVKTDLRDTYPFGMITTDMEDIVRLHASSGTTGKPTVVGYTQGDIDIWSEVMARTLCAAGVTKKSVVQVAFGYGLFTGGLGAHYGVEKIGAAAVPASTGNTKRQLMLLEDLQVEALCCTPSYAMYLAEAITEMEIDLSRLNLKYGIFGAEPWTEEMREKIDRVLGIRSTDIYGLSEIIGPGVSFECECRCGMHINEDYFYPEIIDPDTLQPLPDGEEGELVITTLTKEGMPLLRYRTRDITRLHRAPCACGRTSVRMDKVVGRSDDMLIIRGINVFPSQIESVLVAMPEVSGHYLLVVDRQDNMDTLEVWVEVSPGMVSDTVRSMQQLTRRMEGELRSALNVNATVKLVEPKTLERSEGKAVRVVDKRKQSK